MADKVKLSLIIPTIDRGDALYNLLKHLESQTAKDFEIVIVEQSDKVDQRVIRCSKSNKAVKLIHISERGLPNARNVGIKNSSGGIILFIDDDVIPDKGLIMWHIKSYEDEEISGVGGRIVGGYDIQTASDIIGEFNMATGKIIRNFSANVKKRVKHLPGGNMSFRREVFDRVGFFDISYGGTSIGEETDFCLRAGKAGFEFLFEPRAALEHLHIQSGGCRDISFSNWLYWHAHNAMLFAMRYMNTLAIGIFLLVRILRFFAFSIEKFNIGLFFVGLNGLTCGAKTYRLTTKGASPCKSI